MDDDARFEDAAADQPVRVIALDSEDLTVIATLVQDAVLALGDMSWQPARRRFAMLVHRFRWEDRQAAEMQKRDYERVRSLLVVSDVLKVSSSGIDRRDKDTIVSILDIAFAPGEDGAGTLTLTLAGDGAIALDVECLDVSLTDVTRPYRAPSGRAPKHQIDD